MPELPEVETIARGLSALEGQAVTGISFLRTDLREPVSVDKIQNFVTGSQIVQIKRRGKYLLWKFVRANSADTIDTDNSRGMLICHLGMSGAFRLQQNPPKDFADHFLPHTHWYLQSQHEGTSWLCCFTDPRRFGRLSLWLGSEEDAGSSHPYLRSLGPEPLDLSEEGLAQRLKSKASRGKRSLKALLLDQEVVAGLGNIYASEALFKAGIKPIRLGASLTDEEWIVVAKGVKAALQKAINLGGSTLRDFRGLDGQEGLFAMHADVYGRDGKICKRCGGIIKKIVQQQRATYYCPACQV